MTNKKKRNPNGRRNTLIAGFMTLAFAAYLLVFLLPDLVRTVGGPRELILAEAAEIAADDNTYVSISDGEWDCDTITYVTGPSGSDVQRIDTRFTEVFLTGDSGRVVLLAQLSGEVACEDLEGLVPEGYLNRMTAAQQQELTNEVRLARFINATDYLEICGYCGTSNSLIGALFGIVFAVGGLALIIYGISMPTSH